MEKGEGGKDRMREQENMFNRESQKERERKRYRPVFLNFSVNINACCFSLSVCMPVCLVSFLSLSLSLRLLYLTCIFPSFFFLLHSIFSLLTINSRGLSLSPKEEREEKHLYTLIIKCLKERQKERKNGRAIVQFW